MFTNDGHSVKRHADQYMIANTIANTPEDNMFTDDSPPSRMTADNSLQVLTLYSNTPQGTNAFLIITL